MKKEIEDIYDLLTENDLPIEGVFAPYFLTLFLYSTPIKIAERIIDWFLYRGEEFMLEMTIQMLKMKRAEILKFRNYEAAPFDLQIYLSKQMVAECWSDKTIKSILNISKLSEGKSIFFSFLKE